MSRAVREKKPGFLPRTQSSIAVSVDGKSWVLFNASPDIRQQIAATPPLQPRSDGPPRHTPIAATILTNADVDHIAGLLSLRERQPFILYATARVLKTLRENSIFQVLDPAYVVRKELPLQGKLAVEGSDGPLGLTVETFAVPGKVALFLEDEKTDDGNFGTQEGDTIGVKITATVGSKNGSEKTLLYIPGCARVDDELRARLEGASCLLFDGTVFTDTEMQETGVGEKTGARMGHIALSGPHGSLKALSDTTIGRRVFVHINNTNPILAPGSKAEKTVMDANWEISHDGMEIEL